MRFCLLLLILSVNIRTSGQLPFKNDNVLYHAVFLNEAFRLMEKEKDYLLLDVRSPGEYADTSSHTALNIGRFKGAVNIDVNAVAGRLDELGSYKEKPVFIYCSHSQRSRRISKLLSENGFKKVYNINGGMSLVNELDETRFPYKTKRHESNTDYKNIASVDAANLIKNTRDLLIIDTRTEKEFASADSAVQNNIGRLRNAINLPHADFASMLDEKKISNKRPVLLYDLHGHNSMDLVQQLKSRGFTDIYNLFEGLEALAVDHAIKDRYNHLFENGPSYQLIDPQDAIELLRKEPQILVVDTRTTDEFENKSSVSWHNLGRIRNAINIPAEEVMKDVIKKADKSQPVLVYGGMGSGMAAKTSEALVKSGFRRVYLLYQGLYRFVWSTFNIESCRDGRMFLTHHDSLY